MVVLVQVQKFWTGTSYVLQQFIKWVKSEGQKLLKANSSAWRSLGKNRVGLMKLQQISLHLYLKENSYTRILLDLSLFSLNTLHKKRNFP